MPSRTPNARGSGEELRKQLVSAASALLLEPQSLAAPSLRAVARSCNVSPAAVYLHFDSQQALLLAVVDTHLAELERAVVLAVAGAEAGILEFALAYARWGLAYPGAYQLLFEGADRLGVAHRNGGSNWRLLHDAAALLAPGAAGGEADYAAAVLLWAALHGVVSLRIHKPDVGWPPLEQEISTLVQRLIPA